MVQILDVLRCTASQYVRAAFAGLGACDEVCLRESLCASRMRFDGLLGGPSAS